MNRVPIDEIEAMVEWFQHTADESPELVPIYDSLPKVKEWLHEVKSNEYSCAILTAEWNAITLECLTKQ